jgi:hypothetical protein
MGASSFAAVAYQKVESDNPDLLGVASTSHDAIRWAPDQVRASHSGDQQFETTGAVFVGS